MLGPPVLLEGGLVAVLLVQEEDARVVGVAVGEVVDVPRLLRRRRASSRISPAARSSSPSRAVILATSTYAIQLSSVTGLVSLAEALDLDGHLVPVLQQHLRVAEDPDAGRRAGGDEVAGHERHRCARRRR